MSSIQPWLSSSASAGVNSTADSFSNSSSSQNLADNSNVTASAQTAYAPQLSANEGGTVTYNGSDYGAVAAASELANTAANLVAGESADAQLTARSAIQQAGQTVGAQGAQALSLITKPAIIIVAIIAAVILAAVYFIRRK